MRELFGKKDGKDVWLYTLENDAVIMKVMNYGAALVSFIDKNTGIDVVQGYDTLREYEEQNFYTGASVGRTANRIAKGFFMLNGREYHLPVNNNGNCNHGGIDGFNHKVFDAEEKEQAVVFSYLSPDGEEGYPGNLQVTITYTLEEDGIEIEAKGTADQDTLFAYTNHSYFNLDCSEDALDHEVKINASEYALSDPDGLAMNVLVNVEGTPFDFREFKKAGQDIGCDNEQLAFARGYDHFYRISGEGMREMAVCRGKKLELTVSSDLPGMHFYSSNWLEGIAGKYGMHYPVRSALCFEAEYMPNAVNYDIAEKPVVREGETSVCHIRFTLKGR